MLYFSRWKTILIWLAVLAGVLFALPNVIPQTALDAMPGFVPKQKMQLGLDLQGGVHLQVKLDRDELRESRLKQLRDDVRGYLRDEGVGYTGLSGAGNKVSVTIRNTDQIETAKSALEPLFQPISGGVFAASSVSEVDFSEPEPGKFELFLSDEGLNYRLSQALSQTIEVFRRRIDQLGTTEPIIQRQGEDRIIVQVPGYQDPEGLKRVISQAGVLTFQMVDVTMSAADALQGRPPAGSEIYYSTDDPPVPYLLETRIVVSGEDLADASAGFDQRTNEAIVQFRFNQKGAQRFGLATQQNVGKPFAIVLDNAVVSAPVIREPILGGTGQISGSFTVEGANELALVLRSGSLPLKPTFVEERTVGPSLGADSIAAGEIAGIIGAILVVVFMVLAYGYLGIVANIALAANIILIVALLSVLGATLTLPGIAGIVLTVGMAVDSNVLIYERIREERRAGRSVIQAIDAGFQRALTTIVDANVTTLIAAIILFYLGSGPIRGFAVTLAIGIVTTVFTAFIFTRWMIAEWVRRQRPKELPKAPVTFVPADTKIPFMGLRRVFFTLSAVTSIGAMVAFAVVNMNYGIDFKGGSIIEVQAKGERADVGDIRARLSELNLGDVQVQGFGGERDVLIRVEAQGGGENAEQTVITNVRDAIGEDYEFRRVEVVGPTVSGELAWAGTIAVLASLVAILAYIWIRFEWQFALGAIIATTHDVVLTIGMYVLTGLEFNLSSIAAVLTIVGYSLNDTVVVYDRVRELLRRYKKMPMPELLDLAMNQTLPRTTLTALTTLLALFALWLFGGEVLRSFVTAMIFGVVVGTYSSIFIAGPLLILFRLRSSRTAASGGKGEDEDDTAAGDTQTA